MHTITSRLRDFTKLWSTFWEHKFLTVDISHTFCRSARRLQDGHVVYVAEVLVVIKYNVLDVRSGYTRSVVV